MDVSKSENLTVLNQNNNVQEMLNNEIQNNEILSLSEDKTMKFYHYLKITPL